MIKEIVDPLKRDAVVLRARKFVETDERRLSKEWLSGEDIFCVAQENDNHSSHREPQAISGALGCFPGSKWFLVEVSNSGLANPVELVRPVESLLDSDPEPIPGNWDVLSFLLFSDTHDAAILYSAPYEYKLIAGSAQFVRKYIEGCEDEPLAELQSWFEEDIRIRRDKGQLKQAEEIRKTLNTALAQVKLPPSFG